MNPPLQTDPADQALFGLTNGRDVTQTQTGLQSRYLFYKQEVNGAPSVGIRMNYPEPNDGIAGGYYAQNKANILEVNQWHHFTFTYSPDQDQVNPSNGEGIVRVFHDGEANISFKFGGDSDGTNFERPEIPVEEKVFSFYPFNGNIDDIRIYNRVLPPEQVAELAKQRK